MPPINCTSKCRMCTDAPAGLADHGERFGQNLVERRLFGGLDFLGVCQAFEPGRDARPELRRFGPKLFIGELLHLRLQGIDGGDGGHQLLDDALVRRAENLG